MGVPFYRHWFSLSIRRNRKSYVLADLTLFVIMTVVGTVIYSFPHLNEQQYYSLNLYGLFMISIGIISYLLGAQRLRDINIRGLFILLLIPINAIDIYFHLPLTLIALMILWFIPGTKGVNRFGPDPCEPG